MRSPLDDLGDAPESRSVRPAGTPARPLEQDRIHRAKGSPREVGLALGKMVGQRLLGNIDRYIEQGPGRGAIDWQKLHRQALTWLHELPERFQDEIEGLAEGSGVPLQRVAEWCYVEECSAAGCTAFTYADGDRIWVGRNNDIWMPSLWGFATVREVDGLIPTISFGLEAEPFTATGVNRERLWLHYNFLPEWDLPKNYEPSLPPYVMLTTALETCRTLADVESLLDTVDRRSAMMLFAIDGKSNSSAIFECGCATYVRRDPTEGWMVGTNHRCSGTAEADGDAYTRRSKQRYQRVARLLADLGAREPVSDMPPALASVLSDAEIEGRGQDSGTVYSNVACPSTGEIWYTFGGYPAASAGNWQRLEWPWD